MGGKNGRKREESSTKWGETKKKKAVLNEKNQKEKKAVLTEKKQQETKRKRKK